MKTKLMADGKGQMTNVRKGWNFVFPFSIFHFPFAIAIFVAVVLSSPIPASAEPSQDQVFKSISNNVDSSISGRTVLGGVMAVAGVVMLMVFLSRRQERSDAPKATNSQAKLMRELVKTAGLKPAEVKQLRTLADKLAKAGRPVESPVTLMLASSWVRGDRPAKDV